MPKKKNSTSTEQDAPLILDPPPETTAADTSVPPGETPLTIAERFRMAAQQAASEAPELQMDVPTRGRGRPPKEERALVDVGPTWTADGIGRVVASTHDMIFRAYDLAELEPEESKLIAEQSARALNRMWPTGATYEPIAAALVAEISVIGPRVAAYQMRLKEQQDKARREKTDLALVRGGSLIPDSKKTPEKDAKENPPKNEK